MLREFLIYEGKLVSLVTFMYIAAFAITFSIFIPLQSNYIINLPMNISLLFLPHGIRIITVYLYGWKSIFYLLPGHIITWSYLWYSLQSEQHIFSCCISILSSFLAMCITFQSWNGRSEHQAQHDWKLLLAAGAIASLGNGIGHAILYGQDFSVDLPFLVAGYMIGDLSGLFGLMVAFIFLNKALRNGPLM